MTDRNKFEQMLEHLINEESDKAKELFHQLVVEKSREIYENILSEDFNSLEEENEDDEEVEETFGFAEADEEDSEADNVVGGDGTDDFIDDIETDGDSDEFNGDEEDVGVENQEDRIRDLEDALDDLRAEFEELLSSEDSEEEHDDMDMGTEEEGADDNEFETEESFMREYIEKVSAPKHGDDGASTKSVVAKKNDMGGTTTNILKGGEATGEGTKGGLLNPSAKEDDAGNVNVPGGKAGVNHLKKVSAPAQGDNGDKSAGSPVNGVKSRAK